MVKIKVSYKNDYELHKVTTRLAPMVKRVKVPKIQKYAYKMQKKYAHFLVLYAHKNNIIAYLLYWYKFGIIFIGIYSADNRICVLFNFKVPVLRVLGLFFVLFSFILYKFYKVFNFV